MGIEQVPLVDAGGVVVGGGVTPGLLPPHAATSSVVAIAPIRQSTCAPVRCVIARLPDHNRAGWFADGPVRATRKPHVASAFRKTLPVRLKPDTTSEGATTAL